LIDFGVENLSKIDPKGDRKQYESWDGFWMALGSIFGGFWAEVGGQVGAKLAQKSQEMGCQDEVKKIIKNHMPFSAQRRPR